MRKDINAVLQDVRRMRPLCETQGGLLLYKNNTLYLMDSNTKQYHKLSGLPDINFANILASKCRLLRECYVHT